jgi:putative SOS response-associated peptidase YedK
LGLSTINAKAESLMEKPMWRTPFKKRRCLVVADGFYEWKKLDAKTKQPYAFGLASGDALAFAGLYEHWKAADGREMDTYAIVTTGPNEVTAPVHNRMPVILKPGDYDRWLSRDDTVLPPIDLLRPYDADLMQSWKVDARVGNVRNNDSALILANPA